MVVPGDLNGDGQLTDSDISAFVMALTDPTSFASTYTGVDPNVNGDFNGDGVLNNGDIVGFVDALNVAPGVVPEPTSLAMLGLSGLLFMRRRRAAA